MSLRLRQAIPGRPRRDSPSPLASVTTDRGCYFVYPSSTNVVLLDPDGDLHDTLPFWDALPHRAGPSGSIRNVGGVCARGDLVLAWSGIHVVLWTSDDKGWHVHSTIVANDAVTSIDYRTGVLAVGTNSGVELWRTDPSSDVVVWDRIWTGRTDPSPLVALPPETTHVAWTISIQAFGKTGVTGEPQVVRQPREIEWIGWRSISTGDAQLYVITVNSVLRIYATVLDDPSWFQLLYSMDYRAFRDAGAIPEKGKSPIEFGAIWVPDGDTLRKAAKLVQQSVGGKRLPPKTSKILDMLDQDEADVAVWFSPDGDVYIRSILNLNRAPPTLIKSEAVASFVCAVHAGWSSRGRLLQGTNSLFLAFPPTDTLCDITTLRVSLVDFFAGRDEALEWAHPADFESQLVLMTQTIEQFVRTPNGRGLLAIGEDGEIGVWEKRRLGKMALAESRLRSAALVGKGQWTAPAMPILYAIYAKGRGIASYYNDPNTGPRVVLQHLDPGDGFPTEPVVLPQFAPKPDDKIELLLALSDIDDGYSARRRRTRRAVIMAVAASGEAWVWRVDPAPGSPRTEFVDSPFATPARSRFNESPMPSPARRNTMLPESSPVRHTRGPAESPVRRNTMVPGSPESSLNIRRVPSSIYHSEKPIITLLSHSTLPVEDGKKPRFIIPVDPMGWHQSTVDWETDTPLQDMVVTLSETGVLEFWTPRLGQHLRGEGRSHVHTEGCTDGGQGGAWTRSSVVRTERTNVLLARTSSRKKTVLVCEADGKQEVTIWDSDVSEFSTGLELSHCFDNEFAIQDLDWTTTSDLQSVLAIGFPHHVVLVCEQRMSYVEVTPGWAPFLHIDMNKYTSVPINDSVWIAGGSLAVGAGNQIYVFSRFLTNAPSPEKFVETPDETRSEADEPEDIFELIAQENGPLFDFHPTMLHQCLMWDKIDIVKRILVTLVKDIRWCENEGRRRLVYQRLDPLAFHQTNATQPSKSAKTDYSSLFSTAPDRVEEDDNEFTPSLVQSLLDKLDGPVIVPLTQTEKSSLAALAQATLEVEESRRSLDICGLRYLISIRTFANRALRGAQSGSASGTASPVPSGLPPPPMAHARISFRNIVWATHSESHHLLLQAATASCDNNKMMWEDAKRLGVFLWLSSQEAIRNQLEVVARNRFMAQDERDPISASLFFFALGKKQVVHGLWRQAPGHREQQLMLKFLANDFTLDRWKAAAMKNAYALLSKQRYEYAAAFFMLADSPKDAITVCLRQLDDWQLAVALARAVEGDGPLFRWILSDTVLPIAFGGGHRWLASWALWMLKRRDLAVRVIISPMEEVASAWDAEAVSKGKLSVGQPDNDDPSLLLLFQHLRSRTLQTAKGTSEITPKLEFDFVVHNARVFWRMGCHPLGLDLLRSWSFERPWFPPPKKRNTPTPIAVDSANKTPVPRPQTSPYTPRRRSSFMLARPVGRDNMLMDMDPVAEGGTEPPTRVPSPTPKNENVFGGFSRAADGDDKSKAKEDKDKDTSKAGPNLMKGLRNDVQQGSAVFNMDSFFAPSGDVGGKRTDSPAPVSPPAKDKAGGGANLMKDATSDASQGGVQFNLDSFGGGSNAIAHPPSVSPSSSRASSPPPPTRSKSGTSTPAPPTERKGANLMKAEHANANADQGGAAFNFDSFFPGAANQAKPAEDDAPALSKPSANDGTRASPDADGVKEKLKDEEAKNEEPEQEDVPPAANKDDAPEDKNKEPKQEDAPAATNKDGTPDDKSKEAKQEDAPAAANKDDAPDDKKDDAERKGANLMKDLNPNASASQGAQEFNFDSFGF